MLTFAEEILLLALDDEKGTLLPLPAEVLNYALAGAVLMELAFQNRVDSDPTHLIVLDTRKTGEPFLDDVLEEIASKESITIRDALYLVVARAKEILERTLQSLVDKGILERQEHRLFWVLKTRRYPLIDDKKETEVRTRIRSVVLDEEFPGPRDVVLINLMDACELSGTIFSFEELSKAQPRIQTVAKLDLLGQAIAATIEDIRGAIIDVLRYANI